MPYLDLPADLKLFYTIDDYTDPWLRPESILFVHGACESTEVWRGWVPYLSRRYRLIRIDQRGFGQSSAVARDFPLTTELFVDDLVGVINRLASAPVHLVGAKSGGIGVINLATTRPDLVKTITLASTPVIYTKAKGSPERMEKLGMRDWAKSTMADRLGSKLPQAGIDWWVDLMGGASMSTMQAYLRWVNVIDLTADLSRIKCPTLVLTSASSSRDKSDVDIYRKHIPNLELVTIPVDGYHPSGADPDSCARATLDFLGRHTQQPPPPA